MGQYFGKDVDEAILEIKKASTTEEKNIIFVSKVMPAFKKLIAYHYHKMPIAKNPEVMQDCLVDLYEKIDKFDEARYQRGFPYFNMIVKHFFFQKLKQQERQIENDKYAISLIDYQSQRGRLEEYAEDSIEEKIEIIEFINIFKENLIKWKGSFKKEKEKEFVDALITLFDNAENIDIYNKKAIYWYLKGITGLNSKQIAINIQKVKKKFDFLKKKYQRGDI